MLMVLLTVKLRNLFSLKLRMVRTECNNCFPLSYVQDGSADTEATCEKLKGDLLAIFNVLPKDMQELLLMNPQTAHLLVS